MAFEIQLEGKTRELDTTSFGYYKYWPHTPETVALYKDYCEKVSDALNLLPGWGTSAHPSDYQFGTYIRVTRATCTEHEMSWIDVSVKTCFRYMTERSDAVLFNGVRWLSHKDIWIRTITAVWFKHFLYKEGTCLSTPTG